MDAGAALKQRLVHGLLVVERDSRRGRRKQGGAAAGYQAEHEVVRAETRDQIENPAGRLLPRRVGNGMGGLDHLDPLKRADAVAVARDDKAGERLLRRPMGFDRAGHRRGGLARADDDRAPRRRRGKIGGNRLVGGGGRDRGVEHVPQQPPLSHGVGSSPPAWPGLPQAGAFPSPISWRARPSSTRAMPE